MRSSKRYVTTILVTVGVAVGSVVVAAPGLARAEPMPCVATMNLFIPGTWETDEEADPARPVGMLAPIAEAIQQRQGANSAIYFTPYMARAFDNGYTYADSKSTALNNARSVLLDYGTRCPAARFTINGYSQGADAAGDIAADIGNDRGPIPADRVLAVGLLSDPGAGTNGEIAVGPGAAGTGIADPRPQGMGKLTGRVTSICDPKDLYCSIQKGDNPLLGALGSILSKALSGTLPADAGFPLASALTADFSRADLPGLAPAIAGLTAALSAPAGVDVARVRTSAGTVLHTLNPLVDLLGSGAANPAATAELSAAPEGTADRQAGEVLSRAAQSNLPGVAAVVAKVAEITDKMLSRGVGELRPSDPKARALRAAATAVSDRIAPLAATPPEVLGAATRPLSLLKPTVLVDQALDVATAVTAFDLPAIIANLALLPQRVIAMDAEGVHQVASALSGQLQPLVRLVGTVDLGWISQVLAVLPDALGFTGVAATVTSILSGVDIKRLAELVGRIQDVAWSVLQRLVPAPGQAPDLVGAGVALSGLLPIGQDLAAAAADLLRPKPRQQPPNVLGRRADVPARSIAAPDTTADDPIAPFTRLLSFRDLNLGTVIRDGLSAASFVASGAHTNYGALIVDDSGRNAVQWLGDWMNQRIGRVK